MELYHVSADINRIHNIFVPRIPLDRMEGENITTSRICVSKTIEGALSAFPEGGLRLDSLYDCRTESIIIRVYEFEVSKKNIIDDKILYEKGWVNDANLTQECWIIKNIKPQEIYDIEIKNFQEGIADLLTYSQLKSIKDGADYEDVWTGSTLTLISDVKYNKINIIKQNEYKLI